ncbi:MAG: phosphate ABC transporter substrate-binding protein PstS [Sphingobium sp.]
MLTSSSDGVPVLEPRALVRRRFAMSLGVMAVIAAVVLLLAGQGSNDRIVGSGSTAAQPLVQKLSTDFQTARSGDSDWTSGSSGVDYEAVGSLGGIMRLSDPEVDFAIADYPLSDAQLARLNAAQFPIMIGSIAPVYNPGGQKGPVLRFSPATLSGIFSGAITRWNDPAIASDNGDAILPDSAIKVIHRADGSGTTLHFSTYLARNDAGWQSRFGAGTTIDWATGTGVKGSSEMARAVAGTPGSIGYLETGQARRAGVAIAMVRNAAGRFVAPAEAHVLAGARAVIGGTVPGPDAAQDAYPLASVFHVVMKRQNATPSDNARALRLFSFLFDHGQQAARSLDYLPLPAADIARVRASWTRELGTHSSAAAQAAD